jgi:murein DD-endopeptidase MepM/ murein hydrolase activator NlpD
MLIVNQKFSDFYTQVNYAEEIEGELKDSLDKIQIYKEALAVRKADLERSQTELNTAKEDLKNRQLKYQEEQDGKTVLLYQTKASESEYASLLLQTKQQQNQIDSEIINLKDEVKRKLEALEAGIADSGMLSWPVSPARGITAYFHDPEYPFRYLFEHPAIDIRVSQGTEIKAPAAGYVSVAKDSGYGYSYIILIHDNGLATVYGHVSAIYVKADQIVKRGQIIGKTGGLPGTRGAGRMTTGPHLHLEVRLNGIPVNALDYLP